ncbi:hypothetical protein KIPB_005207 [Kipferlia bialata]|uniref:Uncharacterized protein n=1 Tax=Kipferlia bialata TaxID=797122 RepID=A0A9K3CV08_9EUKA|nr:hypothetical protein KIPB_005207 [Kipferlia bialata]|eukprot:g5207.t1
MSGQLRLPLLTRVVECSSDQSSGLPALRFEDVIEPHRMVLHTADLEHEIPLSTQVGLLKALVDPSHIGPLILSASWVPVSAPKAETVPPQTLSDTSYPTLSPTLLARLPGMALDTDTVIVSGDPFTQVIETPTLAFSPAPVARDTAPVVSVLSACHSALLTICDKRVVQALPVANAPIGDRSAVSTQGGRYHILTVLPIEERSSSSSSPLASLHAIEVVGGQAQWVRVEMNMSPEAFVALEAAQSMAEWGDPSSSVLLGRDTETGSLIVAVGAQDTLTEILSLSTSGSNPTLSLLCHLESPLQASMVTALSCSGGTATLSMRPRVGERAALAKHICLSNGAVYGCAVKGVEHSASSVGTVYRLPPSSSTSPSASDTVESLGQVQIALRDHLSLTLLVDAPQYSVHGTSLLYVDSTHALHALDLTPLRECSLLPAAQERDILLSGMSLPWRDDGSGAIPFKPTLQSGRGCVVTAIALEAETLDVVGCAVYDCATCEWSVSLQPEGSVDTLPMVSNNAITVGDCMYACVRGQLLTVPVAVTSRTPTTLHPQSLTGQPLYSITRSHIVLPTPCGHRLVRVAPDVQICAVSVVECGGVGQGAGEYVGSACVNGVVTGESGCYSVCGGVWSRWSHSERGQEAERETGTERETVLIETPEALASRALSPSTHRVEVSKVGVRSLLAGHRVDEWAFSSCTFTDLSTASLVRCTFTECSLSQCNFSGTSLLDCLFKDCDLADISLSADTSLTNVTFEGCDMPEREEFSDGILAGDIVGLPLTCLTDRDLTQADFDGQEVSGWDLTGSSATSCDFTSVEGLTVEHLSSLISMRGCICSGMAIQGLDLRDTDATGTCFVGADLTGCVLNGANLTDCDLTDANLSRCVGLTPSQLQSMGSVRGATLSGVDMRGWDLHGVDLRGTNLRMCLMGGARVDRSLAEGAIFPLGQDSPTVQRETRDRERERKRRVRFKVAQGVSESQIHCRRLPPPTKCHRCPVYMVVPVGTKHWTLHSEGAGNLCGPSFDEDLVSVEKCHEAIDIECRREGDIITLKSKYGTLKYQCDPHRESTVELWVLRGTTFTLYQ